jgi:hypothetical protein
MGRQGDQMARGQTGDGGGGGEVARFFGSSVFQEIAGRGDDRWVTAQMGDNGAISQ